MTYTEQAHKAEEFLRYLCLELPSRSVGSPGNRSATARIAQEYRTMGFQVEVPEFDCIDWHQIGAWLRVDNQAFEVFPSPYSLGCQVDSPLVVASTLEELEKANALGSVLLVRGDLAREQLMPKNFPFFNPEEHQRIIQLLEAQTPQAIIAATSRNPELAGGVYPFPLIEDGDFNIPSVFMTEDEGNRLAAYAGKAASLESRARRIPSKACNVVARKYGRVERRIVLTAHIDSKLGTPGALDNASGVVTLLLLGELLKEYDALLGVEIVAFNGEDYYSAAGEILYLRQNIGQLGQILLNINLDGVGYVESETGVSLYNLTDDLARVVRKTMSPYDGIVEGEQWYQGDHMVFVQNEVPAVAITSYVLASLMADITHTNRDVPALVDASKVAAVAFFLHDLILNLNRV